jgi:hypothetical protein
MLVVLSVMVDQMVELGLIYWLEKRISFLIFQFVICSCIQVELPSVHELFVAERMGHSPNVKTRVAMREKFEPCVVFSITAAGLRPALCTHHRHLLNRRQCCRYLLLLE